jgi:superfamily I DNA and/or RNA helicase
LSEHFRCAPEIIEFSNSQFYDGRLVPLRLPTKLERLKPSLLDVRVSGGEKNGKVNEREADKIVEMIKKTMGTHDSDSSPRSIGVISLIGDEQSRLIRGRLLDAVGPELLAKHNVLVSV